MKVAQNCVVSIDFKLTNEQGETLDASADDTPLIYLQGAVGVVPGLEKGLEGKIAGEPFKVTVTPADGFGEHKPELIQHIASSSFPDPGQLQPGTRIQGTGVDSGQVTDFVVTEITEDYITVDSNHPLAGMILCFEGVIQDVREATEEEISQGLPL